MLPCARRGTSVTSASSRRCGLGCATKGTAPCGPRPPQACRRPSGLTRAAGRATTRHPRNGLHTSRSGRPYASSLWAARRERNGARLRTSWSNLVALEDTALEGALFRQPLVSSTLGRFAAVAGRLQGEELARSVWRRRRWHAAPRLCAPFDIPPRPGERRYPVGCAGWRGSGWRRGIHSNDQMSHISIFNSSLCGAPLAE